MRAQMFAVSSLAVVALVAAVAVATASEQPVGPRGTLVFSDEFDGDSVNWQRWKPSDYWGNQTLSGNGEMQCYVPEAISQKDGVLRLTATPRRIAKDDCFGANVDMSYASGMVTTAGCSQWDKSDICGRLVPFAQAFGYFEIRARFPKGRGLWPAFWLLQTDGVWPPEIDVFESIGERSIVYHAYHFHMANGEKSKEGEKIARRDKDYSDKFHVFAVDWRPGRIIWTVDGEETFRVEGEHVARQPMYLLINLAVGGHWAGPPPRNVRFPATLEVDYVRVWRTEAVPTTAPVPK